MGSHELTDTVLVASKGLEVEIGHYLSVLLEKFPSGFFPSEATAFLKGRSDIGGFPNRFKGRSSPAPSQFYAALAEEGFMTRTDNIRVKGDRWKYSVVAEALEGYTPPQTYPLPQEMAELLKTYIDLRVDEKQGSGSVQEAIETMIMNDRPFFDMMGRVKEESPGVYYKGGGEYLDFLQSPDDSPQDPKAMMALLTTYMTVRAQVKPEADSLVQAINFMLVQDQQFLKEMIQMKREDPTRYESNGGKYLEKLLV